MPVGGGAGVDRTLQVEHLEDAERAQIEDLTDDVGELAVVDLAGAEGLEHHGGRLGHADGVGELDLALVGETGGDDVLGHVACRIGGGTVDLGRVLAGERATTVTGHAAVGVDDDLAPGQAAVTEGAAGDEPPGRVDVELRVAVQPLGRQHRLDDVLHHRLVDLLLGDVVVVLGGQHHGVTARDPAGVVVGKGDLALGVGTQPGERAVLAQLRVLAHQAVGEVDRRGHEGVGLVARVAEHQALVAGALILRAAAVDALVDVLGLCAERVEHRAGGVVEALLGAVVADLGDRVAHDLLDVHGGRGLGLAGDQHHARLGDGLGGDARLRVLGEVGVQNRIGDLVAHLVRVAFRNGFRGKEILLAHESLSVMGEPGILTVLAR